MKHKINDYIVLKVRRDLRVWEGYKCCFLPHRNNQSCIKINLKAKIKSGCYLFNLKLTLLRFLAINVHIYISNVLKINPHIVENQTFGRFTIKVLFKLFLPLSHGQRCNCHPYRRNCVLQLHFSIVYYRDF